VYASVEMCFVLIYIFVLMDFKFEQNGNFQLVLWTEMTPVVVYMLDHFITS
jgi:hypothetical protein